jgi:PilZ domain
LPQADNIERSATDLDDLDRERLINLIFHAAELGGHLRRSPRTVTSIAIQVRSEKPGQRWEEKTETRLISRYGALVKTRRSLEIDENLRVERLDNGRKAVARVAWHVRKKRRQAEIGIEFLNCDNFWELDWNKVTSRATPEFRT